MSWLGRLWRTLSRKEAPGLHLNYAEPHWEVEGPQTFNEFLRALMQWAPADGFLYLEGGYPDQEIKDFLARRAVPPAAEIDRGTIWPRPRVDHLPASQEVLEELAAIMEHHAEPELAIHFHVYQGDEVLLEWHDAFMQPMLISGSIPEETVKAFAQAMGTQYRRAG